MPTVEYSHEFQYTDMEIDRFPVLQFQVQSPGGGEAVDVDAYLDSGARYSLFEGSMLSSISLDLMEGQPRPYYPVSGLPIEGRIHRVRLIHDRLGTFELDIGFSTGEISRNLLGRDFFDKIQIGFREHSVKFFIEVTP